MVEASIVVTGARSSIGQSVIRHLLTHTRHRIVALVSSRPLQLGLSDHSGRLAYFAHDLSLPLPQETAAEIYRADLILHMAWDRSGRSASQTAANLRMLENLFRAMRDPTRFFFLSSVAAGNAAPSAYGHAKFQCERYVAEHGGTNLVVGLLVSIPPIGGFRLLSKTIERIPVSLRFIGPQPRAYPVSEEQLLNAFVGIAHQPPEPGIYGVFNPGGVTLTELCRALEVRAPRIRVPLPVPITLVFAAARLLDACALGDLAERLRVFFWKDDGRLAKLQVLPGLDSRRTLSLLSPLPNTA